MGADVKTAACPAPAGGECICGQHTRTSHSGLVTAMSAAPPVEEPVCNCGTDHGDLVTAVQATALTAVCQCHGTYTARSKAGEFVVHRARAPSPPSHPPVCTCVAEGQPMTIAAVAALKRNCSSHKTGGTAPVVACTCGQLFTRQQPPVTAAQAVVANKACGTHGTSTAKVIAGA